MMSREFRSTSLAALTWACAVSQGNIEAGNVMNVSHETRDSKLETRSLKGVF